MFIYLICEQEIFCFYFIGLLWKLIGKCGKDVKDMKKWIFWFIDIFYLWNFFFFYFCFKNGVGKVYICIQ